MNLTNQYDGRKDLLADENLFTTPEYAGFWLRFAAYIIDTVIIYTGAFLIGLSFGMNGSFLSEGTSVFTDIGTIMLYLAILAYFPVMESSKWQATLGKRVVGIKVTQLNGERIHFGNALGRFFAKIISAIILYIGFIMAGFTEKKQGLHDMIAGTLVVKS